MLDDKYIDSLVKQAADFGNGKIHIIVNNAGYTWDGVIHKVCAPDPSTSQAISLPAEMRNLGSQ